MDNLPLVSVTIPVYNAGKFLKETIESVLSQTYRNFELILVNDASTDNSKNLILSYSDPRIIYLENPTNSGIVKTRNNGLTQAKGKYIAILDADDISLPQRLEKQVAFLEAHSDYGLCGTFYEVIDTNGNFSVRIEVPSSFTDIHTFLLFNNCFCHSSVMIRAELIKNSQFTQGYDIIEDYEMAYRLSAVTKLSNIPLFITKYRVHGTNQTITRADRLTNLRKKMDERILTDLKINFTEQELASHSNFINSHYTFFKSSRELEQLENWLMKLYNFLEEKKEYNMELVARIFIKRWILMFYITRKISPRILFSGILWKFRSLYFKYLFEFIGDRFSKKFMVA